MTAFEQPQNEALIRLMILAKYQDRHLSLLEESSFSERVEALEWQSITPAEIFVKGAFAQVRDAIANPQSRSRFLRDQCARFETDEHRRQALAHLEGLIRADGIGDGEDALLVELHEHLAC